MANHLFLNESFYNIIRMYYSSVKLNESSDPFFNLTMTVDQIQGFVGFGYFFYNDQNYTQLQSMGSITPVTNLTNTFKLDQTTNSYAIASLYMTPGSSLTISSCLLNGIEQIVTGEISLSIPALTFTESVLNGIGYKSISLNRIIDPTFKIDMFVPFISGNIQFEFAHYTDETYTVISSVSSPTNIYTGNNSIQIDQISNTFVQARLYMLPESSITISSFKLNDTEQITTPIDFITEPMIYPMISYINPTSERSSKSISIVGTNLSNTSVVNFGNTSNTSFVVTSSGLNVSVPIGTGTVSIAVIDKYGNYTNVPNSFTYLNPIITRINPTNSPSSSSIQLIGSNLTDISYVSFGNTSLATFSMNSNGLNVSVPIGEGNVSVIVVDNFGNSTTAGNFHYDSMYVSNISPNVAPMNYPIVINGEDLSNVSSVWFGETQVLSQNTKIISRQKIIVSVPEIEMTESCSIILNDKYGNQLVAGLFTQIIPIITDISPVNSVIGDIMTIHGNYLSYMDYVVFDTYHAKILTKTDQTITCIIPYGIGSVHISLKDHYNNIIQSNSVFSYIPEIIPYKTIDTTTPPISTTYYNTTLYVSVGNRIIIIPEVGSSSSILLPSDFDRITGITVENGILYLCVFSKITTTRSVWKYDLTTNVFSLFFELFTTLTGTIPLNTSPQVVKIYKNRLYLLCNSITDYIYSINLDGTQLSRNIYVDYSLQGITFYENNLFISAVNKDEPSDGRIWKMDLSANLLNPIFITNLINPIDLICIGNSLFIDGTAIIQYNVKMPITPIAVYSTSNSNYNSIVQGVDLNQDPILYVTNITTNTIESIRAPPINSTIISVSDLLPSYGTLNSRVIFAGQNFLDDANTPSIQSILFGQEYATNLTIISTTLLFCDVPIGSGSTNIHFFDKNNNEIINSLLFQYENPSIISFFPKSGIMNDTIEITGTFLNQIISVQMGDIPTEITHLSNSALIVKVPDGTGSKKIMLIDGLYNTIDSLDLFTYSLSIEPTIYYFNDGYYRSINLSLTGSTTVPTFNIELISTEVSGSAGFGYVFYSDSTLSQYIGETPTYPIVVGTNSFQYDIPVTFQNGYVVAKLLLLPGSGIHLSSFKINQVDQLYLGEMGATLDPIQFVEIKKNEIIYQTIQLGHVKNNQFSFGITIDSMVGDINFEYVHYSDASYSTQLWTSPTELVLGVNTIPINLISESFVIARLCILPGSSLSFSSYKIVGIEQTTSSLYFNNTSVVDSIFYNDDYCQTNPIDLPFLLNDIIGNYVTVVLTIQSIIGSVGYGLAFYNDLTLPISQRYSNSIMKRVINSVHTFQFDITLNKENYLYGISKFSLTPGSSITLSSILLNGNEQIAENTNLHFESPVVNFIENNTLGYRTITLGQIYNPDFQIEMNVQSVIGNVTFGYIQSSNPSYSIITEFPPFTMSHGNYIFQHNIIINSFFASRFHLQNGSEIIISSFKINNVEQLRVPIHFTRINNIIRSAICFPKGMLVKTDQGSIEIQKLIPNIHTINKETVIAITETYSMDKSMVCFEKDSLRKNYPNKQTVISRRHKIYYKGTMKAAHRFVGKRKGIKFIPYYGEKLYNVLLEDYGQMNVNGMLCETLHPKNPVADFFRPISKLQN